VQPGQPGEFSAPPRVPLYRRAQEQLKRYIEAHNLRAGDSLPPESVLATELGMSRLSLREATKSLESLGVVEARQGEGIFVKPFTFDSILDNLPYGMFAYGKSLKNLFEVRSGIELGLIGMVIERATAEHLDAMDAVVDEMARCARTGAPIVDHDREFHQRLFAPLENELVVRLIDLFWETYYRLRQESHPQALDPRRVHRIHADVVTALRTRDPHRARAAMAAHFEQIPPGVTPTPESKPLTALSASAKSAGETHPRKGSTA
jgi:DNA-binding FadR family transcriptional regulator